MSILLACPRLGRIARAAALSCVLAGMIGCPESTLWLGSLPDRADAATPVASVDAGMDAAAPAGSHDAAAADGGGPLQGSTALATDAAQAMPSDSAMPTAGHGEPNAPSAGSSGGPSMPAAPPVPPANYLPSVNGTCPMLKGSGMYTFGDPKTRTLPVQIYIAPDAKTKAEPGGALIMYWHAFGSNSSEVMTGFGKAAIDAVVAQGGVVAAFNSQLCVTCGLPDDVAWYPEDDAVSDQVVACAIQQAKIDLRRIHALGFSAGALHSMHLAVVRSGFIASVVSYSGGEPYLPGEQTQDPSNKVAALLAYGKEGLDMAIADFPQLSLQWYGDHHTNGFYTMLCDHGGSHMLPTDLAPHVYRFLSDHPYRVSPEPYSMSIPSEFPSYCANTPQPH